MSRKEILVSMAKWWCVENALVRGKYIGAREFKEKDMGKHKDIKGKRKGEKEVDKEGDFWIY